jgi:hypothetical protein
LGKKVGDDEGIITIHHGKVGNGLIADRTVVHAVGAYRISFTVQVYIHINVEEVFTCNTTETDSQSKNT